MSFNLNRKLKSFLAAVFSVSSVILIFAIGTTVYGQDDVVSVRAEGTSKAESSFEAENAIKQMLKAQVARAQVISIIGEKRFQKSKPLIEARIIREADRFVPSINAGKIERAGDVWKLAATINVSISNLRQLISDNGLMMGADGPATLLPMIEISDRVRGQQYRWWMNDADDKKTLNLIGQNLQTAIHKELSRQGFYLLRPHTRLLSTAVPESFRNDRFQPEDLRFWGQLYNAQIILRGDVRIRESSAISGGFQISLKLTAIQAANTRTVAEVARTFETEAGGQDQVVRAKFQTVLPEIAKDLSAQVVEAWQKGSFGANRLRLSVRGRMGPKQLTEFKSQIAKAVTEIKGVRERIMEPGQVTFEVDYAGSIAQLSEKMRSVNLPNFVIRLAGTSESLITVDIGQK